MKIENILLGIAMLIFLASTCCSALQIAVKTANNIAREHCEQHVYSVRKTLPPEQRYELTPEEWCDIRENIQPFIDVLMLNEAKMRREMEEE